jgi:hypothetical protein
VCNQVVGPPLFKAVIGFVNESNIGYVPEAAKGVGSRIRNLGNIKGQGSGRPKPRAALCITANDGLGDTVPQRATSPVWLLAQPA